MTTLLCFCALSFIFGRFVQEIPGLPQAPSGVRNITTFAFITFMQHQASCLEYLTRITVDGFTYPRSLADQYSIHLFYTQFTKAGLKQSQSQPSRRQAIEKQSKEGNSGQVSTLLVICSSHGITYMPSHTFVELCADCTNQRAIVQHI